MKTFAIGLGVTLVVANSLLGVLFLASGIFPIGQLILISVGVILIAVGALTDRK